MTISKDLVLIERLKRQRLLNPVETPQEYAALFGQLQPVSPIFFSCPGDPPSLVHRAAFDDREISASWRESRQMIKGRFLKGTIGYVLSKDLDLYANAFRRPLEKLNYRQELVYNALLHIGPLTPRQIKEETGLLNKEIMPILHRLQEAFLVYEDQIDSDWERAWYIFSSEWPDICIATDFWQTCAQEVLRRFLHAFVFATTNQIKDWSGWPSKDIKNLLNLMQDGGDVVSQTIGGLGEGWTLAEDAAIDVLEPAQSIFMLHKSDPLVRAAISDLNHRFSGLEVLQYLLIDGDFRGAVCGHWRIGPHDVEDIVIDLDHTERISRREEIIQAVAWKYHPPSHRILRCAGEPVEG